MGKSRFHFFLNKFVELGRKKIWGLEFLLSFPFEMMWPMFDPSFTKKKVLKKFLYKAL